MRLSIIECILIAFLCRTVNAENGTFHSDRFPGAELSHPPICTATIPSMNDVLCVYTYASFSNNRGISIFTTPDIHSHFALLLRRHYSSPDPTTNATPLKWESKFIPGKGIGVRATSPLTYGEKLSSFTPVLLSYLDERSLTSLEREHYLRTAIEQLPTPTRSKFLDLTRIYDDDRIEVQDVIKANSFELQVGGVMHLAVFPESSRFNHDCAPNTQYYMDAERLTHVLHATREVREGEELSIAYIDPLRSSRKRGYHLKAAFHFMCGCERCSNPDESDVHTSMIHSLHETFQDWDWTEDSLPSSITQLLPVFIPSKYFNHPITNAAEYLIKLHEQEGLQGFVDTPYGHAALAYASLQQEGPAMMYAEKALRALRLRFGPAGGGNEGVWEGILTQGIKGHWSWGRRLRKNGRIDQKEEL
ncbi:uncharacterized protein Z518_03338 [Rhinocladiella mackenziei CBS 650.93]|uniref:SET domain-containing protein n=1 Tax=Rhinocladiella mackenziei CBS 650.93 TaxID=1442369 RepID=A0A0D2IZ52_9EURO|nr:uncharacterized protein Z518_03338 [Rhinocladiella mackenziei CBS 650.93]KIX08681.1 hypothetical protein Z518_03338 [Rhinocladiella mackenziei CBS 650.93]